MPKVKTCKFSHKGASFSANMNVSSDGVFSIVIPYEAGEGHHNFRADAKGWKISGPTAGEVETKWRTACKDKAERSSVERKVIIVRFESTLRPGGKREFFSDNDAMLVLKALVAVETKTEQGGEVTTVFTAHPDYSGFGKPTQPFPHGMRLRENDLRRPRTDWTVVEWTQEIEDTIVRACEGINAVALMLDRVLTCPDQIKLAAQSGALISALPYTPRDNE